MKVILKTMLATLLAIVTPAFLLSQTKPIPINVSLFNESTAIPFTRFITTPVHQAYRSEQSLTTTANRIRDYFRPSTHPISITTIWRRV